MATLANTTLQARLDSASKDVIKKGSRAEAYRYI